MEQISCTDPKVENRVVAIRKQRKFNPDLGPSLFNAEMTAKEAGSEHKKGLSSAKKTVFSDTNESQATKNLIDLYKVSKVVQLKSESRLLTNKVDNFETVAVES